MSTRSWLRIQRPFMPLRAEGDMRLFDSNSNSYFELTKHRSLGTKNKPWMPQPHGYCAVLFSYSPGTKPHWNSQPELWPHFLHWWEGQRNNFDTLTCCTHRSTASCWSNTAWHQGWPGDTRPSLTRNCPYTAVWVQYLFLVFHLSDIVNHISCFHFKAVWSSSSVCCQRVDAGVDWEDFRQLNLLQRQCKTYNTVLCTTKF